MTRRASFAAGLVCGVALVLVPALPASFAQGGTARASMRAPAPAGQTPAKPLSRAGLVAAAKEMMEAAGYCALITNGEDGHPQAREIDAFPPEDDLTVWIATKATTRKVGQIRQDPRVTLYYQLPGGTGYVTLLGRAVIITDPAEKGRRWKEAWASFYDDRNRGDDYTLIKVTPFTLEIVSLAHNIVNDPAKWRPVTVDLRK